MAKESSKWTNKDGTISKHYLNTDRDGNLQSNIIRTTPGDSNHDHSWFNFGTSAHGFRDDGYGTLESHKPNTTYGVDKTDYSNRSSGSGK